MIYKIYGKSDEKYFKGSVMSKILAICIYVIILSNGSDSSSVISMYNNGPAVCGSNVTFTVIVEGYEKQDLKYIFSDNIGHYNEIIVNSNTANWTVEYPRKHCNVGENIMMVKVLEKVLFVKWWKIGEAFTNFNLTNKLNGNLTLIQDGQKRPNKYVAVNQTVTHTVMLPKHELDFLLKNSSSIVVYWYIDCQYIGQTTDFFFNYTYGDLLSDHDIDVVVIANNQPLPPVSETESTTTSTTTTTATEKPPSDNSSTASSTSSPTSMNVTNGSNSAHAVSKRDTTYDTQHCRGVSDSICSSGNTKITTDTCHTHGTYHQSIKVIAPVTPVNIDGLNWIQHGDLLHLQVKYSGTPPFYYCTEYKQGLYNITGNETCENRNVVQTTSFPLVHYFQEGEQHTVLVIVENYVTKQISKATINTYQAQVQAQLSVIVIPVVFCLIAITIIIFGVAYYQHQSRYTVEVADFDFGQQTNLDYKTFSERLRDSFRDAFRFRNPEYTDPLMTSTRYDSMS